MLHIWAETISSEQITTTYLYTLPYPKAEGVNMTDHFSKR